MNKFLPSYVGSKSRWIKELEFIRDSYIVELFCGSSTISAELANRAILNDLDIFIYKIFKNYNKLIVPDIFTQENFFEVRSNKDWYLYSYCLQKMSFSGVFRYSKNGYNVPVKKNIKEVRLKEDFEISRNRFNELNPKIYNKSYECVDIPNIETSVVILDPPYEGSSASYNKEFDYHKYWEFISIMEKKVKKMILFDRVSNMPMSGFKIKNMRVNGKYKGDEEAMFLFKDELKKGSNGEIEFLKKDSNLKKLDGLKGDFLYKDNKLELKSDYYDMNKSSNFFIERWSDKKLKKTGGPWQAYEHNCKYYIYYFIKNDTYFLFDTKELVDFLDSMENSFKEIEVVNSSWVTTGYKVERKLLNSICLGNSLEILG